jgi:hypothetical protein
MSDEAKLLYEQLLALEERREVPDNQAKTVVDVDVVKEEAEAVPNGSAIGRGERGKNLELIGKLIEAAISVTDDMMGGSEQKQLMRDLENAVINNIINTREKMQFNLIEEELRVESPKEVGAYVEKKGLPRKEMMNFTAGSEKTGKPIARTSGVHPRISIPFEDFDRPSKPRETFDQALARYLDHDMEARRYISDISKAGESAKALQGMIRDGKIHFDGLPGLDESEHHLYDDVADELARNPQKVEQEQEESQIFSVFRQKTTWQKVKEFFAFYKWG